MSGVSFTVYGRPAPAGSKRAFTPKGWDRAIVVDANPKAKGWKQEVAAAALEAANGHSFSKGTPVVLNIAFFLARPKSHYGSGRNSEQVKPSAPARPTSAPDCTKLLRGAEDALTAAGIWHDDAQVVRQVVDKHYGHPERAEITVRPLLVSAGAVAA